MLFQSRWARCHCFITESHQKNNFAADKEIRGNSLSMSADFKNTTLSYTWVLRLYHAWESPRRSVKTDCWGQSPEFVIQQVQGGAWECAFPINPGWCWAAGSGLTQLVEKQCSEVILTPGYVLLSLGGSFQRCGLGPKPQVSDWIGLGMGLGIWIFKSFLGID